MKRIRDDFDLNEDSWGRIARTVDKEIPLVEKKEGTSKKAWTPDVPADIEEWYYTMYQAALSSLADTILLIEEEHRQIGEKAGDPHWAEYNLQSTEGSVERFLKSLGPLGSELESELISMGRWFGQAPQRKEMEERYG